MDVGSDQKTPSQKPGSPRSEAGLAVSVVLTDVIVSILSNKLSDSSRGIVIILIGFVSILAALTYVAVVLSQARDASTSWRKVISGEWRPLAILASLTALVMLVLFLVWPRGEPAPTTAACTFSVSDPGVIQPAPSSNQNLGFCPVRINDGHLPIDGKFRVEGKVLGLASQRKHMLLAVSTDPETCDTLGKPGSGSMFVLGQVTFDSSDGTWSYVDDLGGYPPGVTLGRIYEFIGGPDGALQAMRRDHINWNQSHKTSNAYPGIATLPGGAQILAKFRVPPGTYNGEVKKCAP